ncbi:MAG: biopolymer transporter ExbD [Bacteroidales bacterium]|nr:biopolymer transporter ExbD [Bacteroidales bacterium]
MAKFARKGKGGTPAVSTASLPDIVFMLLFFFMVSTTMREVELKIQVKVPEATEVTKLENKSLVSYIYVGSPLRAYREKFGTEPRIQLNDKFETLSGIIPFIDAKRATLSEGDAQRMFVSIKADSKTKMGIITDIKEELRLAQALKINYSTRRREKK